MRKELTNEKEVAASADAVWAVYSSPNFSTLIKKLLPGLFKRLEILEGDGGLGTIVLIEYNDPAIIPHTFHERFRKLDSEKRLLEVEVSQGGFLELGCTFYMSRMHILEKGPNSCVIESTLIYEAPKELMGYVSQYANLEILTSMAEVISKYVLEQQFQVFGVVVKKPKLGLSTLVLQCIFILLVIVLGGLWIGDVSSPSLSVVQKQDNKKEKEIRNIMRKELTNEKEVAASADAVWAVYSSPNFSTLLKQKFFPGVFKKLEIVEGEGGVGTIVLIEYNDPAIIPHTFLERTITQDHEKRLMEVEVYQGGYLELGFTSYMSRMHILERGPNSCIIESTLIYEAPEELMESVSQYANIGTLSALAEAVSKYVLGLQCTPSVK